MKRTLTMLAVVALLGTLSLTALALVGTETRKIVAEDGNGDDNFGFALDLDGALGIIGAPGNDLDGLFPDAGVAYIYDITTGERVRELAPNGDFERRGFDEYGRAVALDAGTAVVGSPQSDDVGNVSGSVFIFDAATGDQLAKLLPFNTVPLVGNTGAGFGSDVAVSGGHVVVGAPGTFAENIEDPTAPISGAGAVYIVDGDSFELVARVVPSDPEFAANFGWSVAIDGETVVVGAPFDNEAADDAGAVYVLNASTGEEQLKLTAEDGSFQDFFGIDVAVSGSIVAVGAYFDDDNGSRSGSVYLFDASTGEQLRKITAPDGMAFDQFGRSVDLQGDALVVGAWADNDTSGSVYVFDVVTGDLVSQRVASDATIGDVLGRSVAVDGATFIAGAPADDDRGTDSGSVYVFDLNDPGEPPAGPSLRVESIDLAGYDGRGNRVGAEVAVRVTDNLGRPASGVSVSVEISGDIDEVVSGVTDGNGEVTVRSTQVQRKQLTYMACVTDVEGELPYLPDTNIETCDTGTVTSSKRS